MLFKFGREIESRVTLGEETFKANYNRRRYFVDFHSVVVDKLGPAVREDISIYSGNEQAGFLLIYMKKEMPQRGAAYTQSERRKENHWVSMLFFLSHSSSFFSAKVASFGRVTRGENVLQYTFSHSLFRARRRWIEINIKSKCRKTWRIKSQLSKFFECRWSSRVNEGKW